MVQSDRGGPDENRGRVRSEAPGLVLGEALDLWMVGVPQTAARKVGFLECERLHYRYFRFQGGAVFAGIKPPHTDVILFEREFEQSKQRHSLFEAAHYSGGETANV